MTTFIKPHLFDRYYNFADLDKASHDAALLLLLLISTSTTKYPTDRVDTMYQQQFLMILTMY